MIATITILVIGVVIIGLTLTAIGYGAYLVIEEFNGDHDWIDDEQERR